MAAKLARMTRSARSAVSPGVPTILKVGDLLAGKYRVRHVLGEGGMGVVVAAHHEWLEQDVAIKLLYQEEADREAQERLINEARASARIQSDHVARVLDVDVDPNGLPFIVMELLEGADLCEICDARGALPRWLVVDYMLQALEGLAHAHARGIVHRDLKPSNLFLANRSDGSQILKILDFGISKSLDPGDASGERRRAQQLTGGRTVLGSPPYMSPEQVRSPKSVDHRTDIWSLGVLMYELLTNAMPFGGEEVGETFAQILEKEPTPIRSLVTGVPEGLEAVVARCLMRDRERRYQDVAELAAALVPYGSGTWIQSADRVASTLQRVAAEEASSPRLKGHPPVSGNLSIPSAPGRRVDSGQPEFAGTSSTVVSRLESRRTLVAAVLGVVMAVGLVVVGIGVWRSRQANVDAPPAAAAAAAPTVVPEAPSGAPGAVVIAGGIQTPNVHTAAEVIEKPPTSQVVNGVALPAATLVSVGASVTAPVPPPPAPAATEPPSVAPPVVTAAPRSTAPTPRRPAAAPRPAPRPATAKPGAKGLPLGLPSSRE
jgi:eukaryotic-like serine/threonine-protein kinase